MQNIEIDEAQRHFLHLIEAAANGKPFIITIAGKPLVKVVAWNANDGRPRKRLGFMAGLGQVPDDFDQMGYEIWRTLG